MLLTLSTLLTVTTKAAIVAVETTASCAAGTDADGDFLTGVADPDCTAFNATTTATTTIPTSSVETAASCAAGTDADGDFLTGVADPDCAAFNATSTATTTTTTPVPPVSGGGGVVGSSFGSGPVGGFSGITSGTPVSNVITSTSTCDTMKTFMKKGRKNNVAEVKRLQAFLNGNLGLNIPTTGFFGNMTFDAVKTFQLKYRTNVLTPWGIDYSTGYFYKTTQRQMNMLLCPGTEFPMPVLN